MNISLCSNPLTDFSDLSVIYKQKEQRIANARAVALVHLYGLMYMSSPYLHFEHFHSNRMGGFAYEM